MSSGARLLLIDDARLAYDFLSTLLEEAKAPHTLTWKSNYAEGLAALLSGEFDLCFLDYQLGTHSGLDLLRAAVAQGCHTAVVMLTGQGNRELDHEAMKAGAADYLEKSAFTPEAFERLVRYLVERARALERLRDSEERFALAVRGANDGIWDWRVGDTDLVLSARWKGILGYDSDELPDRFDAWRERVHVDDLAELTHQFDAHVRGETEHFESEHRLRHRDGTWRHVLMRGQAVRDSTGRARRLAGSLTDITNSRSKDPLTGLPNRVLYLDRLELAFHRARRDKDYSFAVLFVDLDRFKTINDSLGHALGDELLVDISRRLLSCVRVVDTVARIGGDEFTILLDDAREPDGPARVANRILDAFKRPFQLGAKSEVFSGASIGIVTSSPHYTRPEDLLRDADTAMYEAKAAGRGQYVVFDATMRARALKVLSVESGLRHALSEDQLVVYYQPIFALPTRTVVGFEALVRWQHPDGHLVPPAEFIPIAEDARLIVPVDLCVIRKACAQLAEWHRALGNQSLFVSLNASRHQFTRSSFANELQQIVDVAGVPASAIRLEVTESVTMDTSAEPRLQLQQLDSLGVQLVVDDFGIGYSSLSVLQKFPFRGLKIDRSFISNVDSSTKDLGLVRAMMSMAAALELSTTAEGIETEAQLRCLVELGCTRGQGYLLGRPEPAADATRRLGLSP